ncbi:MAG: hypothetical protein UV80_C0007G0039 [Candidatus Peregrinibacteria bacterium GW2011_GWF2_43_17]|nr:MAG: hypothetical protein UV80_C0007G0039 [Candidatus Peregrinibacteria bacterium GW2011_GWF2_43_17]KKT18682.1 MAG: hypothetical protein UW03_C0034G0011 [Candidatus Peregrinibacteria bacterium GW2011_GWA2_43_8]HAU39581.1 hypothetical protein [Candidatus Peregrinibacteria bacterium]
MQKIKNIRCERGVLSLFASPLSCVGTDPQTKNPMLFFKSKIFGEMNVFTDKTKTVKLLKLKHKRGRFGYATWEIFDAEKGDKLLGTMAWAIFKTVMAFGAEKWEILKPDGGVFLTLEIINSSVAKRVLDEMTNLYNPTHEYVIKNGVGKVVGYVFSKRGFWNGTYSDLKLEESVSEEEMKMAVALFAGLVLLYKK